MVLPSRKPVDEPPFPWKGVLILLGVQLTEPIVMAMIFPMAPFMVREWVEVDAVGVWAGALTSAYNLASIPASVFWGRLSDTRGRKPIMIILLIGTAASTILFGLSRSLTHAILARSIGGLFSGIAGVVIASLRDITTEAQRATAVASISWSYGVGFCVGPLLGGMLINPTFLHLSLFNIFPYLLPCLVVAMLVLASGAGLYWLPPLQVRPATVTPASTTTSTGSASVTSEAAGTAADADPSTAANAAARTTVPDDGVRPTEQLDEADSRRLLAASSSAATNSCLCCGQSKALAACRRLACNPVFVLLLAQFALNFAAIGSMEVFPLYLSRNESGGLGLTSAELAGSLLPQAVVIFVMPLVYPLLSRRWGHKGVFFIGSASLVSFNACLPLLQLLAGDQRGLMWAALLVLSSLRGTVGPLVFPAMVIIFNQAVTARVGFYNGLASSVAAVARAVAPFTFGSLFAQGTRAGHASFPLDVTMPFELSIFVLVCAALLVNSAASPAGDQAARFASRTTPWSRRRFWRRLLLIVTCRCGVSTQQQESAHGGALTDGQPSSSSDAGGGTALASV